MVKTTSIPRVCSDQQTVVITPGEPSGIGPDLVIQWLQSALLKNVLVVADANLLQQRAKLLSLCLPDVEIIHVPLKRPSVCGKPDPANADYVIETLKISAEGCLNNTFSAIVTGPVQKNIINEGYGPFSGHTEFFAQVSKVSSVVMMMVTKGLRVALATHHLPLRDVASAITSEGLEKSIRIIVQDLQRYFGIQHPRILVCGLNPHAGEAGYLGDEEIKVIHPVLTKLRNENFILEGPLPADTVFIEKYLQKADVVLAMYHDQGLPVIKHKGFGQVVNVTLGLPFVRTSVDHGTALDLAGTGKGDFGSLDAAVNLAKQMIFNVGRSERSEVRQDL